VTKKWISTMLAVSWSVLTTTRPRRSKWSRALRRGRGGHSCSAPGAQTVGSSMNLGLVNPVKPNLCSYFSWGKLCSNPFLDCLSSLSMSGGHLFVSSIKEFKSFVESGEECLSNQGVSSGLEAHHEREQCLVGNRVGGRVM